MTRRKIAYGAPSDEKLDEQGLPPLRESSSSSSTVKASDQTEKIHPGQTARVPQLQPPPPTPPLRLSSKRLPKPRGTTRGPSYQDGPVPNTSERKHEADPRPSFSESRIPAFNAGRSKFPPPRPSREGTPRLDSERPSPIIQSNLSHLETTGHKRRESIEKALLVSPSRLDDQSMVPLQRSPSNVSNVSGSSKRPQRLPSPGPPRAQSPHLYMRDKSRTREALPLQSEHRRQSPSAEPSPVIESPAKSPSRFGFFARRAKSPGESSKSFTEKPSKKGPAAGTGHEGYGKYAKRGRSGTMGTSASRGRSTSTDRTSISYRPSSSRKSSFASEEQPELDDFYKDRLEPVVIGGGGAIRENRNSRIGLYRTSSGESSVSLSSSINFGPPILASSQGRMDNMSTVEDRLASLQKPSAQFLPPPRFDLPSGSTASEYNTLAQRRSLHRSQLFREAEPLKIPTPINTQAPASPATLDSFDNMRSPMSRTDSSLNLTDDLSEGHEGNWLKPKKAQRVKLPNKWNFFHRAQHSPRRPATSESSRQFGTSQDLPAAVTSVPQSRFVPHYAIMDGSEPEDTDTLEDLLHDIEDDLELRKPESASVSANLDQISPVREREHSMLLPSPPKFPTDFVQFQRSVPAVVLDDRMPLAEALTVEQAPMESTVTEPAVVELMIQSGIPVAKNRLQHVGRIPKVVSKRDRPHIPPPQSFSRPFTRRPDVAPNTPATEPIVQASPMVEQPVRVVQTEPLLSAQWNDYPPMETARAPPTNAMLFNLDGEKEFLSFPPRQNSDVSGSSSSGIISFAGMTALQPRPESLLKEDEVWNEYDELLDHVASPDSIEADWPGKGDIIDSFPSNNKVQDTLTHGRKKESPVLTSPRSSHSTVMAPSPPQWPTRKAQLSRLDTLEIPSPHRSDIGVATPLSLSDLYAGYANRSSAGVTNRQSVSSGSRYSSQSVVSKSGSYTSHDEEQIRRYTKVMADKIRGSIGAPDSLRYSALMTARWLCFDRVLFSPVQEEIRNNRQDKVLVLDGLGNDDWSSYCALTYPNATVYNLGGPRPTSATRRDNSWQPPPNHRQIQHASIAQPFPFPKGFFTAAVFRFPTATSESALRNAVSECKRVLRPGGYLELCILDMDMVNMGNRARRAVRGLKVRMQAAEPEVSLSPTSDNIQKMLGRRGFENLNRCVVGVPVAGVISDSSSGSPPDDRNTSLGDMMCNPTVGGVVPVTKMIAKVGRWWWSRCYERSVVLEGDTEGSIWADQALLKECESRDTGFRMVICYAQKPLNVRRRTVSV